MESNSTAFLIKIKLRHSLGRPSRSDFVQSEFTGEIYMVGRIYHVGLTVSDLERSIAFYRDVLGLEFQGEIFM